jgi:hypothetical protein
MPPPRLATAATMRSAVAPLMQCDTALVRDPAQHERKFGVAQGIANRSGLPSGR